MITFILFTESCYEADNMNRQYGLDFLLPCLSITIYFFWLTSYSIIVLWPFIFLWSLCCVSGALLLVLLTDPGLAVVLYDNCNSTEEIDGTFTYTDVSCSLAWNYCEMIGNSLVKLYVSRPRFRSVWFSNEKYLIWWRTESFIYGMGLLA